MAGSSIYMNKAEVEATRGQYESQKAEFLSIVNTIKSTLWDLEGTWTGKAEQTYEAQARELLNNLQTLWTPAPAITSDRKAAQSVIRRCGGEPRDASAPPFHSVKGVSGNGGSCCGL